MALGSGIRSSGGGRGRRLVFGAWRRRSNDVIGPLESTFSDPSTISRIGAPEV